MINHEDKIVQFLGSKEDPVSIHSILKGLGLPKTDRSFLRSQLRELSRQGTIEKHGTKYWVPQRDHKARNLKRAKHQSVKGKLFMTTKGFGFVTLLEGSPDERRENTDWMIPAHYLGKARHGDIVLVDWQGMNRGRPSGRITKILTFGRKFLTGIFKDTHAGMVFKPFQPHEPDIPVMGKLVNKVQPEIVAVYERQENGEWVFLKMIGSLNDPSIDEEMVLSEQGIIHSFPKNILQEATKIDKNPLDRALKRESFEALNVFTVDGEDARDFDDAIHILKTETGFELGVHIADVSNFVPKGSKCDQHAASIGNSTYLPHKAFPMLPRVLSENLCSLNPGVPRLTLSVVMQLDEQGSVLDFRITKGKIVSKYRLTYNQVFAMGVEKQPEIRQQFSGVVQDIDLCLKLAEFMRETRFEQGGLDLQTIEPRMKLNDQHLVEKLWGQSSNASHQMIEMFMCLANEVVATFLASKGLNFPYRIHEPPDEKRILAFIEFLLSAGVRVPRDLDLTSGHSLNRIMDEMKVRSNPENLPIWRTLLLRSLKRAEYSVENPGHFGLGLNYYAHFTSPIRRYADLVLHQTLSNFFEEKSKPDRERESLKLTCEQLSQYERQSSSAEYAFFKLKVLRFLKPRKGETFEGKISDVKKFGIFVELNDFFVSGLISIDKLDDDYRLKGYALVGQRSRRTYKIGDKITVLLEKLDLETRSLDLGFTGSKKRRYGENLGRRPLSKPSGKGFRKPEGKKKTRHKKSSSKTGYSKSRSNPEKGSFRKKKRRKR